MDKVWIKVVRATSLKAADSNGLSDPYVVVRLGEAKYKTEKIEDTLNPVWVEADTEFSIDRSLLDDDSAVVFYVFDWNKFKSKQSLGTARVKLIDLPPNETVELALPLRDGDDGVLYVNARYERTLINDGSVAPGESVAVEGSAGHIVHVPRLSNEARSGVEGGADERPLAAGLRDQYLSEEGQRANFHATDPNDAAAYAAEITGPADPFSTGNLVIKLEELIDIDLPGHPRIKAVLAVGESEATSHTHRVRHGKIAWDNEQFTFAAVKATDVVHLSVVYKDPRREVSHDLLGATAFPVSALLNAAGGTLRAALRGKEATLSPPGRVVLTGGWQVAAAARAAVVETSDDAALATYALPISHLRCMLYQGRNLAAHDRSGTSDPFVKVTLVTTSDGLPVCRPGSFEPISATSVTRKATLFPVWTQGLDLELPPPYATNVEARKTLALHCEVWDWDRVGSNDLMGRVVVPLDALEDFLAAPVDEPSADDEEYKTWYPLFFATDDKGAAKAAKAAKAAEKKAKARRKRKDKGKEAESGGDDRGSESRGPSADNGFSQGELLIGLSYRRSTLAPQAPHSAAAAALGSGHPDVLRLSDGGVMLSRQAHEVDEAEGGDSDAAAAVDDGDSWFGSDAGETSEDAGRSGALQATKVPISFEHKLTVRVIQARKLIKADRFGKSDPYVTLKLRKAGESSLVKTATKMKTLEPKWGETFEFAGSTDASSKRWREKLAVTVFDWDRGSKDDPIGELEIKLSSLAANAPESVNWYKLANVASGEIQLGLTLESKPVFADMATGMAVGVTDAGTVAAMHLLSDVGTVTVTLMSGADLKVMDKHSKAADPFVRLQLGTSVHTSRKIKKTVNPTWNETFVFERVTRVAPLHLTVLDWNMMGSAKFMGAAEVSLKDLAHERPLKFWLTLHDESGKQDKELGEVQIKVEFTSETAAVGGPAVGSRLATFSGAMASAAKYELSLVVVEATDLVGKKSNGLADPFVIVRLGTKSWESPTLKYTTEPRWNAKVQLFASGEPDERMYVTVYDWNRRAASKALGTAEIAVAPLEEGTQEDLWVALKGAPRGKVHLRITKNNIVDEAARLETLMEAKAAVRDAASPAKGRSGREMPTHHAAGEETAAAAVEVSSRLTVTVLEARDLVSLNRGGGSDPYVIVQCGTLLQLTSMQMNSLSPSWGETFEFTDVEDSDAVTFSVFDWERLSADQAMGSASVAVRTIPVKRPLRMWLALEGVASGEIYVEVFYEFLAGELGELAQLRSMLPGEEDEADGLELAPNSTEPSERLVSVQVVEARALEARRAAGSADPYCVLSLGTSGDPEAVAVRTLVRRNTSAPVWHEDLHLKCLSLGAPLKLQILDWNSSGPDIPLGEASIDLGELEEFKVHDSWHYLQGVSSGEVHLKIRVGAPQQSAASVRLTRNRTVYVQVLEASGLSPSSGHLHPYVVLNLGPKSQTTSTVEVRGSDGPQWREAFRFRCSEYDVLRLSVCNWEMYYQGATLGTASLPISSCVTPGLTYDMWLELAGAHGGKLHVRVTTSSIDTLPELVPASELAGELPATVASSPVAHTWSFGTSIAIKLGLALLVMAFLAFAWWARDMTGSDVSVGGNKEL
ncbi:C2 domain-containing protein [Thecamonas trahens ATCC 50062]|uniref:C2 domain-containing protein n=1 Tax=Thecamonas trahens ATCC 50062 TaxID=461836 RepID=A0A0L0D9U8_THETB|nr:C2 domain-containing protein [Thecamonas trahens ATCC 50062]KNC49104.1 C2 domain-containing protein [Thecamonas trahens ATCC 50062]|eukprot:XP_013758132.1 C2 domain-containing protein [Thecamonas trahens ATCC 50062]